MYSRPSLVVFIWLLLVAQSRLDSGNYSDDEDDDLDSASDSAMKLEEQRRMKLVTAALRFITRNASDFHYIARDDHEVIHNLEREMKKKSRKRGAKHCWRKCQRTLKCFQQLASRPKSKKGKCDVCVAKCSNISSIQTQNAGR